MKKITWKASVVDKQSGKRVHLTYNYPSKKDFIHDLEGNGYTHNPIKIKPAEVFDYILDNTEAYPEDWKKYNTPKDCIEDILPYLKERIELIKELYIRHKYDEMEDWLNSFLNNSEFRNLKKFKNYYPEIEDMETLILSLKENWENLSVSDILDEITDIFYKIQYS